MQSDRPQHGILVTGSHRSGSTWVGRILAAADGLHYVHEPFNVVARIRWTAHRPTHQFEYLQPGAQGMWPDEVARAVALRFPWASQSVEALRHRRLRRLGATAVAASRARRQGLRPLIKDPIAVFSTEWMVDRFALTPVVLIRDPVAFVGSLKERNWAFDFWHWADQPLLLEDLLAPYRDEIMRQARQPGSIVEQGILQWNAFYSVVCAFRERHPDWLILRYEDLAADPAAQFQTLYRRLGLPFGQRQQAVLSRLSSGGAGPKDAMDLRRDSTSSLESWRARLTPDEVEQVRRGTAVIAQALNA